MQNGIWSETAPAHLIDIVPTIVEVAGGKPQELAATAMAPPAPGQSLVPAFTGDGKVLHDSLWWQHEGNRALRVGDWKIVAAGQSAPWELYDLKTDRAESNNLADAEPDRVRDMAQIWARQFEEFCELAKEDSANDDQR